MIFLVLTNFVWFKPYATLNVFRCSYIVTVYCVSRFTNFRIYLNENKTYFPISLNELKFGLYEYYLFIITYWDFRFKLGLIEKLGIIIWNWTYGRAIQHGRREERSLNLPSNGKEGARLTLCCAKKSHPNYRNEVLLLDAPPWLWPKSDSSSYWEGVLTTHHVTPVLSYDDYPSIWALEAL